PTPDGAIVGARSIAPRRSGWPRGAIVPHRDVRARDRSGTLSGMSARDLAALVSENVSEDEVVDMCAQLVRAPSENPPGDEREVAAVAERLLRSLGLDARRVEPAPGRI